MTTNNMISAFSFTLLAFGGALSAQVADGANSLEGGAKDASAPKEEKIYRDGTYSMFTDTLRATHIMTGTIVDVEQKGFDRLIFKPDQYLKGAALADATITIDPLTTADLGALKNQKVVLGVLQNDLGIWGLAHGVESLTPESWGPETSIAFYKDILAVNTKYADQIAQAREVNPVGGKFPYPQEIVREWTDIFVRYLGYSGTRAAHHSARELMQNPVFIRELEKDQIELLGEQLASAKPGTYERGYCLLLLKEYGEKALPIDTCMNMLREETAYINIDHMGSYLKLYEEKPVTDAIVAICNDKEGETTIARRNAIILAGQFGSKLALPSLLKLLGHETDRECKHRLMETFRYLPDEKNFQPLLNYLNGGDAQKENGLHKDCIDSAVMMKRTMVAIAMIDSIDSNMVITQAYVTAKYKWLQDHLRFLLPENRHWRHMVEILDNEEDKPVSTYSGTAITPLAQEMANKSAGK